MNLWKPSSSNFAHKYPSMLSYAIKKYDKSHSFKFHDANNSFISSFYITENFFTTCTLSRCHFKRFWKKMKMIFTSRITIFTVHFDITPVFPHNTKIAIESILSKYWGTYLILTNSVKLCLWCRVVKGSIYVKVWTPTDHGGLSERFPDQWLLVRIVTTTRLPQYVMGNAYVLVENISQLFFF